MYVRPDGWVEPARHLPSPHCDARPSPDDISLLVIHGISLPPGEFGGPYVEQLFLGTLDCSLHPYFAGLQGLRVSSHFFIRRDGELLQFVSCLERAWHAGQSHFAGRDRCNDFSLGIELEGTDQQAYAAAQYDVLAELTQALQTRWPQLRADRIVGHEHIAPGRKTDPGPAFDWLRYRAMMALR